MNRTEELAAAIELVSHLPHAVRVLAAAIRGVDASSVAAPNAPSSQPQVEPPPSERPLSMSPDAVRMRTVRAEKKRQASAPGQLDLPLTERSRTRSNAFVRLSLSDQKYKDLDPERDERTNERTLSHATPLDDELRVVFDGAVATLTEAAGRTLSLPCVSVVWAKFCGQNAGKRYRSREALVGAWQRWALHEKEIDPSRQVPPGRAEHERIKREEAEAEETKLEAAAAERRAKRKRTPPSEMHQMHQDASPRSGDPLLFEEFAAMLPPVVRALQPPARASAVA